MSGICYIYVLNATTESPRIKPIKHGRKRMQDPVNIHRGIPGMSFGWELTSGDGSNYASGLPCRFKGCRGTGIAKHGFCEQHQEFLMDLASHHGLRDELFWVKTIHDEYRRLVDGRRNAESKVAEDATKLDGSH
jgi:hypothetical protein